MVGGLCRPFRLSPGGPMELGLGVDDVRRCMHAYVRTGVIFFASSGGF